ncbi:hypothetical protein [Pectinatus sottacetonis]|uniref:hypothetical protein n=1 Tax=Pectinatus sottacetonis TaxID=1002795 RepID=UPI0018C67E38|nr:hypothetical protein [Pectinatus sottacetonis]
MKEKLLKIIFAVFIFLGFLGIRGYAQSLDINSGHIDDPKAKLLYEEALSNMNTSSADYLVNINVNNKMGEINIVDDIKYQQSPFLMKQDISILLNMMNQQVPRNILSMLQYTETDGNNLRSFVALKGADGKYGHWIVNEVPMSNDLEMYLRDVAAPDQKYREQTQKIMESVREIYITGEDENTQKLQVIFDSKKLFSYANMIKARSFMMNLPSDQKQQIWTIMMQMFEALQDSGNIKGTIVIDKQTHRITAMNVDVTPQIRALANSALKMINTMDMDKNKSLVGTQADQEAFKQMMESVTAEISVKVKPVNNIMELAIPNSIRKMAKKVDLMK